MTALSTPARSAKPPLREIALIILAGFTSAVLMTAGTYLFAGLVFDLIGFR